MAGERMKYSSSLRDCELWCRKERSKCTNLLLGTAKSPTIDSWTPYYQNQSPYGILKIARSRYPDTAASEENGVQPGKSQYAHLCKFLLNLSVVSSRGQNPLLIGDTKTNKLQLIEYIENNGMRPDPSLISTII